eukprot:XP_011667876.1 PREDICTED: probable serine/threonine-protein kinase drkD isoform X2 [Strongylocentrotus purpuratus]
MATKEMPVLLRDIKPAIVKQELCHILDSHLQRKNWMSLAGLLGFTNDDIAMFQRCMLRPGGSPTDEMLTTWDYENHTIEELYLKLYEIKHARCMMFLKDFVRPDLHYLIQKITHSDPLVPEPPVMNVGQPVNQFQQRPVNIPPGHENQFPMHKPQPSSQQSPHYPPQIQNHPQLPQQQQQWGQQTSGRTPSTASYHSHMNPAFQPVDQRMMMSTRPQQDGYNASMQPNYRQEYPAGPRHQGQNDLMRVPSEHPLGGPQRYQSHYSNNDNLAIPSAVSPECLQASRQPIFQSLPQSNPIQHPHSATPSQASSVDQCLSATIKVPYEKLRKATENFSAARRLGSGAFGEVFHAQLDMIDVAIKKIIKNENVKFNESMIRGDQIKEIEALTKYRHKNIVSLTAYSFGEDCICLIFDFMKNGSLEYQLEGRAPQGPLEWHRRHMIAEGAALGIQYLHTADSAVPLIHQDIKSANILLDENFVPKIADFGLARPGPTQGKEYTTIKTSVVFGTKAYLAPEFMRDPKRKLSKKLDVYSFGVVLLELVTGEKAGQAKKRFGTHEILWRSVDRIMDANEGNPQAAAKILQDPKCLVWPSKYMMELVELAMDCLKDFKFRPEMEKVILTLSEMGVRIDQEERHRSSRTQNFPIENTDPLEHGKAVESSDPSQMTEGQDQYGANGRPGVQQLEGDYRNENPKYENYCGFQVLANGPKVQGNVNNEKPHTQESRYELPESRLNQIPFQDHHQMKEGGLRQDEMCARERQFQMQQQLHYHNQQRYEHQYLSPAVSASGNSCMDRNAPPSQSSMSQSPGSSYPSCVDSFSVSSSSDASCARFQGPYLGHPGDYYPVQPQGQYADHMNPHLMHPPNVPRHTRQDFNHMVDGQYEYHGQHPGFGPCPMGSPGPQDVGYHQQPNKERDEDLNSKGSADSTPVSSSSSSAAVSSSDSPRASPYPRMPTLNLKALSMQSSDTSNCTGDTSLSESSKDLPQNEGGGESGDSKAEESCQRERIGMLQSGREEGMEQSNEVHRREPGENTEPQTQPCL